MRVIVTASVCVCADGVKACVCVGFSRKFALLCEHAVFFCVVERLRVRGSITFKRRVNVRLSERAAEPFVSLLSNFATVCVLGHAVGCVDVVLLTTRESFRTREQYELCVCAHEPAAV